MTDIDARALNQRLEHAEEIADAAGRVLMNYLGQLSEFDTKAGAADLVTVADEAVDQQLRRAVRERYPKDLIISEEADGVDGFAGFRTRAREANFTWCIDPLDGTTNFVHCYPNFAVSIGLCFQGEVIGGLVYAPARKEIFRGGRGIPATLNGQGIQVSKVSEASASLVATGFPKKPGIELGPLLSTLHNFLNYCHGMRRSGSAALDLCDVAAGRLDAFYEWGLSPWDLVAGQAIVEAASGCVTDTVGKHHDPFGGSILASNTTVHESILAIINDSARADGD